MKRGIWIGVLVALAFTTFLLVRLPASWLSGALPPGVSCGQISGTVWNGACGALTVRNASLGNLKWRLHAAPLLAGKLGSSVELDGPAGSAAAEVEARSGHRLAARKLRARFALNPVLLPQIPPNLRGQVRMDLSQLSLANGRVATLEGRIDVLDLEQRGSRNLLWGDYILTFPAARGASRDGEPAGDVRSVKGPFKVAGTLRLTREPGFELEGLVAASPGAPSDVLRQLNYLGTPDSQGRRPFSVAGTF